ncbi:MAG: chromosomal replication initiator protein DnaA [Actinobacteria bacterium]|nr:chromosomal replication initiator protein DnaA [Actinomycetota bacterium]MCL5883541.1 chromosomal replication initiator protein DnaA [Actinomycetota bacterium]
MGDRAETIWLAARESIRESLSTSAYEIWFENTEAEGMEEDNTFLLSVPNDFAKTRIEARFLPLIEESLLEVVGEEVPVRVVVSQTPAAVPEKARRRPPRPMIEITEPPVLGDLNPKYTFDSFVIGSSNRFAHAAALAVAEAPAQAYNPFFIYGGVGLGKTHLLQAIGHYVATNTPELSVKYMTVESFTNDFINSVRDGKMEAFKRKYRTNDVLLIDDIQFLENKEGTQEEFFHTFNTLYEAGKQIAISSDRPPREIATLEERLSSRFESGLITDIQPPDVETRIAILRKQVVSRGIAISSSSIDEVLGFIARGIPTNIRELEGALIRVAAQAKFTNSQITLPLAKEALKDILPTNLDTRITIDMIQNETCRFFSLSMSDLKGSKRSQSIVFPRQIAMYLCRELTDSSQPRIGEKFGGRDHTTVIHAINKISKLIKEEREVFTMVQQITGKLKHSQR